MVLCVDASKELLQLAIDRLAQTIQLLQSCQLLDIKSGESITGTDRQTDRQTDKS